LVASTTPANQESEMNLSSKSMLMALMMGAAVSLPVAALAADTATVDEVMEMTATVEDINYDTRTMKLRRADNSLEVVEVSPEVKRFREIKKGDNLRVQISLAIAVALNRHGAASATQVTETAEKGGASQPPSVAAQREIKSTVTVVAVDAPNNRVSISGPEGNVAVLNVVRPEMQAFIKDLKTGDKVDVTYTEAVAIALEPAAQ
jgi:hypothetical protein